MQAEEFLIANADRYQAIRHDIHRHPETAFEEERTSELVANHLANCGIDVHRGLAGTGVVGVLTAGTSNRSIGLRADMDALHLLEANTFSHASCEIGKMHGCGHDGHTTMLLAAAEYLSQTKNFDGKLHFIFQPAEENEGGGRVMVEEGLFQTFPMDSVYGLHNIPGIKLGDFAVRGGAMMAGFDRFDIEIIGNGGHAAMPNKAIDPIPVAAAIVSSVQAIVSRMLDPMHHAVVSITKIVGGETYNVIPSKVTMAGTVRYFEPDDQKLIKAELIRRCKDIAQAHGADATITYEEGYPATVNDHHEATFCAEVIKSAFGGDRLNAAPTPLLAAEDFSFMLQERPGCYIWAGNGDEGPHSCMVHNPNYDFNDNLTTIGAQYWIALAEARLSVTPSDIPHR